MNRFDPAVFTERGIVAIGYAGFAFALGVAAGAVTRRTLSAMAATLLGFIAVRLAFTFWVRPHLLAASRTVLSLTQANNVGFRETPTSSTVFASLPTIPNAWPLSATLVDHAHHAASAARIHALLVRYCPTIAAGPPQNAGAGVGKSPAGLTGGVFVPCLNALSHHLAVLVTYQPASRYWPLQTLETAIFLAAALALIGATVWRLGRRADVGLAAAPGRARHHGAALCHSPSRLADPRRRLLNALRRGVRLTPEQTPRPRTTPMEDQSHLITRAADSGATEHPAAVSRGGHCAGGCGRRRQPDGPPRGRVGVCRRGQQGRHGRLQLRGELLHPPPARKSYGSSTARSRDDRPRRDRCSPELAEPQFRLPVSDIRADLEQFDSCSTCPRRKCGS